MVELLSIKFILKILILHIINSKLFFIFFSFIHGILHMCENHVARSIWKAFSSEIRACRWYLVGFWKLFPVLDYHTQLWSRGRNFVLSQLDVPCLVQARGRPVPFWMRLRRSRWREVGGKHGERRREEERETVVDK